MTAEAQGTHNYPVAVLAALERNPGGVTLSTPTQSMTNGQLATLTRRYAANMALRGISRGSVVVIALRNGPMAFTAALAAGLLGAAWVGMHTELPFREIGTTHLLHGPDKPATLKFPGSFEVDASWAVEPVGMPGSSQRAFPGFSSPDDIAYFTRSSGTTGTVKFMTKTCGYLATMAQRHGVEDYRAITPLAPVLSSMTFRNIVAAALAGARVVLTDMRPDDVGQIATLQRVGVEYVVGSPAQVDALCQGLLPLKRRVGTLRVGGAVMDRQAVRHWLGFFEEVILTYGSREGGGGGSITLRDIDDLTEIAYTPRPECEVEVVSEEGTPLPPSTPGILRLRSPGMVTGYIGAPSATAEVFRDGWFYPGDIAEMTADGRFKVIGRTKDQINLGGIKFNAAAVDEAARTAQGVRDAVCFTTPGSGGVAQLSIAAVVASPGEEKQVASAIRVACERVNKSIRVHAIYFVRLLPTNENGKHERTAMPAVVANYAPY